MSDSSGDVITVVATKRLTKNRTEKLGNPGKMATHTSFLSASKPGGGLRQDRRSESGS
jgi:hypothetical protein